MRVQILRAVMVLIALQLAGYPANADGPNLEVHRIINEFGNKLYIAGETGGDFGAAIASSEAKLRSYIDQHRDSPALTAQDEKGRTPLIKAAASGFVELVVALLENRSVVEAIDAVDPKGMSAWVHANIAIRQSLLICNPSAAENPFAFVPLMVTQAYFMSRLGYYRSREALEKAGAKASNVLAREGWNTLCVHQADSTRQIINSSDDVLLSLVELSTRSLPISELSNAAARDKEMRAKKANKDLSNEPKNGFKIFGVRSSRPKDEGVDVLVVTGRVENEESGNERIPSLRLVLRDLKGNELQSGDATVEKNSLAIGESTSFEARIENPSPIARRLEVTFN